MWCLAFSCLLFQPTGLLARPSPRAQGPSQATVDAALDSALAFLHGVGEADDGRRLSPSHERSGLRSLVLYTLLKSGDEPDGPLANALLRDLARDRDLQTYDVACLLLALAAHDPVGHRAWIESLVDTLVGWQEDSGAFGYPGLIIDLSNTQYAALGLWAASKAGVPVRPEVWHKLATGTLAHQDDTGGFTYTAPGSGATGSMTAAGVGILALCESELALAGDLDERLAEDLGAARARGVDWLDERFTVDTNPGSGGHHYYYLYGLERLGALAGRTRIGLHDWYAAGAAFLVDHQDESGSWENGSDLAQTAFAILFLKRATLAGRRGETPGSDADRAQAIVTEEADADVRLALSVEGGSAHVWIAGFSPNPERRHEWPDERGRGPHVRRVEYWIDGVPNAIALAPVERPVGAQRFSAHLRTGLGGRAQIRARVHVVTPDGEAIVLESPDLLAELPRGLARAALHAWGPNRMPAARARAKGSSTVRAIEGLDKSEFDADQAIDGNPATPWLAKSGDEAPTLDLSFKKKQTATHILLSPATLPGVDLELARPIEVVVIPNGKKKEAITHTLEAAARGRCVIDLGGEIELKRLSVRITGSDGPEGALIGWGEVELRAPAGD